MHFDFGDTNADDAPHSHSVPITASPLKVKCEDCLDAPYGYGLTVRQAKEIPPAEWVKYMRPYWPWI